MPDRYCPPFRADHIGSLLRTPELLQAKADLQDGSISKEELFQIENEAIKSVIALQKRLGYKAITDGEYRRKFFFEGFFEQLKGIQVTHGLPLATLRSFIPTNAKYFKPSSLSVPLVAGKLERTKPIYLSDFESMKALVERDDVPNIKLTMCSPIWLDFRYGKKWIKEGCDVYDSRADLLDDLVTIFRAELADLYAAGCRDVQIDEPTLTYLCYQPTIDGYKEEGLETSEVLAEYIDMLNACMRDVPKDMTVGIHLCRGNVRGQNLVEGSYDPIAKQLFTKLNVNCFYLEYDTENAGGFEPLAHLPKDKVAVLGLVSTKKAELETPELMVSRIEEAVRIIQKAHPERSHEEVLDQLCLSPQCGFASEMMGNPITKEDMEAKLRLVADVARHIWNY